ncbi:MULTISPECIES: universal stress protein [Amycolatopsis]|uniref:Universal stress protein n=1 Tax=Amycolatopsis dongchuanensis TaxID=1070866 RepID=A0ABP8VBZ2_9PSEU
MNTSGVVVGVDGSASALAAVRWAAEEARSTGEPLTLVHAYSPGGQSYAARELRAVQQREQGTAHLREAEVVASLAAPGVRVASRLRAGDVRKVLLAESSGARQAVLGSRGAHSVSRLLLGSAGLALTMKALCPVVVVRDRAPATGPVVVGLNGWPECAPAARFAFLWAAAHGAPVTALRVWHALGTTNSAGVHERARAALAAELAPIAGEFPQVPVEHLVLRGPAGETLLQFGEHARLLVVGARGHTGFARLLLGSTSTHVAGQAASPVAVIRSAEVVRHWREGARLDPAADGAG